MPKCIITQKLVDKLRQDMVAGITITTAFTNWQQQIILELNHANIPFKVYNLGSGVKKITTNTDTCPCCKKKL